jgi:hypothetical protein
MGHNTHGGYKRNTNRSLVGDARWERTLQKLKWKGLRETENTELHLVTKPNLECRDVMTMVSSYLGRGGYTL